jgi:8-oxo-dGTP pyrophosphatase MutT (NUDIX family)
MRTEMVAQIPGAAPRERQRGAYALIQDELGRILTVTTARGRTYLPGGRIEAGETAHEALQREIEEECGWAADLLDPIDTFPQPIMGGSVELEASFWRARLRAPLASSPEHDMVWLSPAVALQRLHRDCDRQAVLAAEEMSSVSPDRSGR